MKLGPTLPTEPRYVTNSLKGSLYLTKSSTPSSNVLDCNLIECNWRIQRANGRPRSSAFFFGGGCSISINVPSGAPPLSRSVNSWICFVDDRSIACLMNSNHPNYRPLSCRLSADIQTPLLYVSIDATSCSFILPNSRHRIGDTSFPGSI